MAASCTPPFELPVPDPPNEVQDGYQTLFGGREAVLSRVGRQFSFGVDTTHICVAYPELMLGPPQRIEVHHISDNLCSDSHDMVSLERLRMRVLSAFQLLWADCEVRHTQKPLCGG